ncbi:TRAP transporter substrate-binding protein [Roseinatronobacter sp. NSM]|uniref:TRAP transporter substrate-binding protein n=1 Tax=Roseinatronobacter sp. NSM TaxID=3457785 RepID=UPI004036326C
MKITVSKWVSGAAAVTIGLTASSALVAQTWRMSHKMPPESIEGRLFQMFADEVAERTGGALNVEVYPSEQLGSDDAVLEQIQLGTIHIYPEGISYLQKWVPEMQFTSAPFLFDDRDHWSRFMASDMVQGWLGRVEDEAGIVVLGDSTAFVRGPYRVMLASRPFETLEEMDGMRLRMHPDELAAESWRHLGAEVRTLAWTETYESIGRGIVEAVNSPIALVESMRFHEVAPHILRHDEYEQGMAFMMSAVSWNQLDEDMQAHLLDAYDAVAQESARVMGEIADEAIERMKGEGATFSELDTAPFVARMAEMYAAMDAAGTLPEGFLDAVNETRE